jgi:cation transport regulator ChaC
MNTLNYFAYGSNMSTPRIKRRIESAVVLSQACLHWHRLRFHKKSIDGSAKCDIVQTQTHDDIVHGVVFKIAVCDKAVLDQYEGLGNGYDDKQVSITLPGGEIIAATTYIATHIDASLKPYHWYKEHVLRGAREHALPVEYIAAIEAVDAIADPDMDKHTAELSIYTGLY